MRMKENQKVGYLTPKVEVYEVIVEQGIATTGAGAGEEIGGSKSEGIW